MFNWSWTYMLVPLSDLGNQFPAGVTQYDYVVYDDDGNASTVHPSFDSQSRKFLLGAKSDTHQIFKISCLDLEVGGDFDQFRSLGYEMMNQKQAAEWVSALPEPEDS
ncbi:MAG: hypothetical protein CL524_01035 [Aequorivita sp.]|nr:hypothetical protein [Aequorivita sp.]